MRRSYRTILLAAALGAPLCLAATAHAHGFVGNRFFPPTITTDDPFAVDEFSLSTTYFADAGDDGDPATDVWNGGFEFDKEIFPKFALGIEDNYIYQKPHGRRHTDGLDDIGLNAKYELWQNDDHEFIFSIGMDVDVGGTGSSRVSDSTTTFTPTLYFGKGFGDLPDTLDALKPIAVTGTLGQTFPTDGDDANNLEWGLAVEYSLPYLQQHVKDIGLPEPFKSLIPLVEFSFETPENRGENVTTGNINPGVLYETRDFQIGAEALIPVNSDTGHHVGMTLSVQIYIDDLFPSVFGNPLFGERQ